MARGHEGERGRLDELADLKCEGPCMEEAAATREFNWFESWLYRLPIYVWDCLGWACMCDGVVSDVGEGVGVCRTVMREREDMCGAVMIGRLQGSDTELSVWDDPVDAGCDGSSVKYMVNSGCVIM